MIEKLKIKIGKFFKLKNVHWYNGVNYCWLSFGYNPNGKVDNIKWIKVKR